MSKGFSGFSVSRFIALVKGYRSFQLFKIKAVERSPDLSSAFFACKSFHHLKTPSLALRSKHCR